MTVNCISALAHALTPASGIGPRCATWRRKISLLAAALSLAASSLPAHAADAIDHLRARPEFSIFVALLDASDTITQIRAAPAITIFAPPNRAFAELPQGALESLRGRENLERLRRFVLTHVVADRVSDARIKNAEFDVTSLDGGTLRVDADDGEILIGKAHIVGPEVVVDNGIVHVIDHVLVPQ